MRTTLLSILLLSFTASSSHAAGPTVGWEWEVAPWSWVTVDKAGRPLPDQKANECPAKLFETNVKSPVKDDVSLVSFTRDLSNQNHQTLEIITGPIDYDDDESLNRIMLVIQALAEASAKLCNKDDYPCQIEIPKLLREMQDNKILKDAKGGPITFHVDNELTLFNALGTRKCVLAWNGSLDTGDTNTQTNVGIMLSSVGSGLLEALFSRVDNASSGWQVSRRAYHKALGLTEYPLPEMASALASVRTRGLFALLAYLMNAETYSYHYQKTFEGNWRGFEGKNVQDVFLKTPPEELIRYVKDSDPGSHKFFDALEAAAKTDKDNLAAKLSKALCVATSDEKGTPLKCSNKVEAMIDLLIHADPHHHSYHAFMSPIPKPISMFERHGAQAFVVEVRRGSSRINKKSTFRRLPSGAFDLEDRKGMRKLLKPFAWH